jgi:hypothetical protein
MELIFDIRKEYGLLVAVCKEPRFGGAWPRCGRIDPNGPGFDLAPFDEHDEWRASWRASGICSNAHPNPVGALK